MQCSADNNRHFFDALHVKIRDEGAVRSFATQYFPSIGVQCFGNVHKAHCQ
ncbi:hypothetical protein BCEN4_620055 [Burkholderia cenocepacia]|nr:hypothetical protein BCEN4_620055 [Burkholderia cenocepacia]